MKKRITSFLLTLTLIIVFLAVNSLPVLADGGSTAYGPYGPHTPEQTGFADAVLIILASVITYVTGFGFLITSKLIRNRVG